VSDRRTLVRWLAALAIFVALISASWPASASTLSATTADRASLDFPNSITFHVEITAPSKITSLVLEYGDAQKTCGQVVAEAYPQITPGNSIRADWTWDMRQSGSLPPGAQVWWRWRYTDESGKETVTDQQTITWLDNAHAWQTISKGDIRLHWYDGSASFAQQLLDAADSGLRRDEASTGLSNDQPVDEYIYADTADMQAAVLYEPSWTGGEAFPEYNIVIIGIGASDLEWGLRAEVHELTHVLVGHYTFTCLGDVPTWLNEGLAVYSEGPLDAQSQGQLDGAIRSDTLLPVRTLSGPFSEIADKANLSYSESYSLVKFLLDKYGNEKMNALLLALRDGNTVDEALTAVYGFNVDGLEDAWRASIGAKPRPVGTATPVPTATVVPTIVPVSGALPAITPTPFSYPTLPSASSTGGGPPLSLTLILIFTCCVLGLVVGVLVLLFLMSLSKRNGGGNEKGS
jgi:hypothetical protein